MKSKKVFISLFIICVMFFSTSFAFAEDATYLEEAEKLKKINVFKGSGSGFDLGREPTRLEGGIMFVRLIGKEAEALEKNYQHPFDDVPIWGSAYVGFLYEKGYTKGVSSVKFGSNDKMIAKSYMTFLLRALEYDDKNGDFSWNDAIKKSKEINMIDNHLEASLNSEVFLRDHLAKLSLDTLQTKIKGKDILLADKLVLSGAFTKDTIDELGLISKSDTAIANVAAANSIEDRLTNIKGVSNYKELDGKRYYRPLSESELEGIVYDSLESMDIHNNEYTIEELKKSKPEIDWDIWMKIKWGKFDWNDNSHGENLATDNYWNEFDGSTTATAKSYADNLGLRLPNEEELKSFLNSLTKGPKEDLGWPSGYYWTSDSDNSDLNAHRFVDSLNKMGQQYNDTRDYFVILVSDDTSKSLESKKTANLINDNSNTTYDSSDNTLSKNGIYASSKKIKGMSDIPGVANSISIDGVLIYRPLTSKEATAILGERKYDYSIPGKYGYSKEKVDEYVITIAEHKEKLEKENPNIDWDMWLELKWPIYDNSFDPHENGLEEIYEGEHSVTDYTLTSIYKGSNMTLTPKYLLDKLLNEYPDGKITSTFGWPTNHSYLTSSRDEFGNTYTTNLQYESSQIHIGKYNPVYLSLTNYSDVIYEKLTESSLAD